MSKFDKFMIVGNWVLLVLLGSLCVLDFALSGVHTHLKDTFANAAPHVLLMVFSLLVVFAEIYWLFGVISQRHITFKNERGEIKVSVRSIEKNIAAAVSALNEVESAEIRVKPASGAHSTIRINAYVKLTVCPDLTAVQTSIQQTLEQRFNEILTTEQPKRFNVRIIGLREAAENDIASDSILPNDFTGPVFPVSDTKIPPEDS